MDEMMADLLVDKLVNKLLEKLAIAGDGGAGAPASPPPDPLGGGLGEPGAPDLGPDPAAGPGEPNPGGGPPPAGDDEGSPVLDDLDDDSGGESEGEDDDMAEDTEKDEKGGKGKYAAEPPAPDASREKYQDDELKRLVRDAVAGTQAAERERYSKELEKYAQRIADLEADNEAKRREAIFRDLEGEGVVFKLEDEMRRTSRYSSGGFDGHVQMMRECYRRHDADDEAGGFIRTAEVPGDEEDGEAVIEQYKKIAREQGLNSGSPDEIAQAVADHYASQRKLARG